MGPLKELKTLKIKFPKITDIYLAAKQIDDRGADLLFACLPNLKSMSISISSIKSIGNNSIGPIGAASIVKHLKELTNLDICKLRDYAADNCLGDKGAMILGKGLPKLKDLTMSKQTVIT